MNTHNLPLYTGEKLKEAPFRDPQTGQVDLNVYIPSPELVEAVQIAMLLQRPLLLMGEPGCGKTILAKTVAYELHGPAYKDHFFRWDIKSTTKAQDGIYHFDAVKRLRMSQEREGSQEFWQKEARLLAAVRDKYERREHLNPRQDENGQPIEAPEKELEKLYIQYGLIRKGPLAKAFDACRPQQPPPVLLIDEIDKAEIDFPNDLLLEIEDNEYYMAETDSRTRLPAGAPSPVIIITSNNEKELPAAFLRRCLFHYIEFPNETILKNILRYRFEMAEQVLKEKRDNIIQATVTLFTELRERLKLASEKQDSTSELIDFMQTIIAKVQHGVYTAAEIERMLKDARQKGLDGKYKIPFAAVLLKNYESVSMLLEQKAPPD
ncbi:MAG: MoxR family ATPase [Bacteroidetes bacterium]|nr:MAG: MoxR family ATPase [Bacteroidota bacterium]